MNIVGPSDTSRGPADRFTGDVYVNPIQGEVGPSHLIAAMVRFTPGARTNWHSHAAGQTLWCTDGVGLVVSRDGTVIRLTPGATVWTPPGEEHWHGAGARCMMSHVAMLDGVDDGETTTWLEPVTDEQYAAANITAAGTA